MALRTKPVLTSACRPCMTCSSLIPYPPAPPLITLLQPRWPAWCSQTLQVLWSCSLIIPPTPRQVSALSSTFLERSLSTLYKRATLPSPGLHVTFTGLNHHLPYIFCLFIVCPLILDCKLYEGRDLAIINYYIVPVYLTLFLAHSRT